MKRIQTTLKQKATETNTALWIIEKDYALSYLLSAIFKVPLFGDSLVLKGGTALKKAYFQDYRFSEDLDFSTRVELNATDLQDSIDMAVTVMEQDLQEREPFFIQSEPLILREPHPGKQKVDLPESIHRRFPNMLIGKALRAGVPHGKVISVDTTKAEKLPGVVKILTSKDIPGENIYGLVIKDQKVFCDDVVRCVGDVLALVIGETEEQAQAGLDAIDVEIAPLPVVATALEALQKDAPVLHPRLNDINTDLPNVLKHFRSWLGWVGIFLAAGILFGLLEPAGVPLAGLINAFSYIVWTIWMIIAGIFVLRVKTNNFQTGK